VQGFDLGLGSFSNVLITRLTISRKIQHFFAKSTTIASTGHRAFSFAASTSPQISLLFF